MKERPDLLYRISETVNGISPPTVVGAEGTTQPESRSGGHGQFLFSKRTGLPASEVPQVLVSLRPRIAGWVVPS